MEEVNKSYRILVEVLTPLNIGAGVEKDLVKGVDYIITDGVIRKISITKIVEAGVDANRLATYFASKDSESVYQMIQNKVEQVTEHKWPAPAHSDNDIKSFIKNQFTGLPIIPGSSLKGALRSILFSYLRDQQRNLVEVFGNVKDGGDFMRLVKISDIEFNETALVNTKIYNLQKPDGQQWKGGWKHGGNRTNSTFNPVGFNTIYEVLEPSKIGAGTIMLSESQFGNYTTAGTVSRKKQQDVFDIAKLFHIINGHTKKYLEKELAFFNCYNEAEKADEIIDNIECLLKKIPEHDSSCILKMSVGSGFNSITGDWQFDDYSTGPLGRGKKYNRDKGKPKSRKIAVDTTGHLTMMGFVRLSIDEGNVKTDAVNKRAEIIKERLLALDEIRAKEQRRYEAELAKAEALKKYNKHIAAARDMLNESKLEDAKQECEKAGELCPDCESFKMLMDDIAQKIKEKENQAIIDAQNAADAQQRAAKISAGMDALNEKYPNGEYKVKDFKVMKSKVGDWLKKSGNTTIPADQCQTFCDAVTRIYFGTKDRYRNKEGWMLWDGKVWCDIRKWIGDEDAKQLFEQTVK